jgi:hypothetical protein
MEETWFEGDTHEEHQVDPSSSAGEAADSRVPFTEDCRRGFSSLSVPWRIRGEQNAFCLPF